MEIESLWAIRKRKTEQEAKTLIQKKKKERKVNVADGVVLLFYPEESINTFDNFVAA